MPAISTSNRRSPVEIVNRLVAQLQAATLNGWKLVGGKIQKSDGDTTPAFEQVTKFDVTQLEEAFRLLLVSENRVAVVVPMDETFPTVFEKAELLQKRVFPISIFCSDYAYGDRNAALWGSDTTPGAYALQEAAIPFVVGQLIANPAGIVTRMTSSRPVVTMDIKTKLPGRAAVALELECTGGIVEAAYGPGPNL